ncbi:hypothetical protein [Natronoglycomyces albus]|uniref:Uncharacterized protein n=1 Tax=Natronoglycomyces albus TaxID=2811108 RepID=A0A895XU14_9ACTN|nr:hypothetical protein [Natronoglycomyces albus]QSB07162.1 hypothetical protein JQS30_17115 [Natronoglycomyces albus]
MLIGLLLGASILATRWRRSRDPYRLRTVVNIWEAADTLRASESLLVIDPVNNQTRAHSHASAALTWLRSQRRYGRSRRRVRIASLLEHAEALHERTSPAG